MFHAGNASCRDLPNLVERLIVAMVTHPSTPSVGAELFDNQDPFRNGVFVSRPLLFLVVPLIIDCFYYFVFHWSLFWFVS